MIVKPTYVFRNLPYLSHHICAFLPHPSTEFRRTYECSVVTKIHGTLIERIEEMNDMTRRGLLQDTNCGAFSVSSMVYCIEQIELFLLYEQYIAFDTLLILCRQFKCEWFCRSIEKIDMKYTLRHYLKNANHTE